LYVAYLLAFYLAVEVQRCPLSSEGPRLRSRCPLGSEAGSWGPEVHTALGAWQLRSSHYIINNIFVIFKIYPNIIDYIFFFDNKKIYVVIIFFIIIIKII
jgi:hypothetical protein